MLIAVLFSPNKTPSNRFSKEYPPDEPYAIYDCGGFEPPDSWYASSETDSVQESQQKVNHKLPTKIALTTLLTLPENQLTPAMFVGTTVEDIAKKSVSAAQRALKDPNFLQEIRTGKYIIWSHARIIENVLSRDQVQAAEKNAFAFFKENYPDFLQFLKNKGVEEVDTIKGPFLGDDVQTWAGKRYKTLYGRAKAPGEIAYYQLFAEHLALSAWWLSRDTAKERLAGLQIANCACFYIKKYLKDYFLVAEVGTHLIVPNLQYGGDNSAQYGDQDELWRTAILAYQKTKQIDAQMKACERMIALHPNDDYGDVARTVLARNYRALGKLSEAIATLETVHPGGSLGKPEKDIRWLKQLLKKQQNSSSKKESLEKRFNKKPRRRNRS